jgi:hypothetical protein
VDDLILALVTGGELARFWVTEGEMWGGEEGIDGEGVLPAVTTEVSVDGRVEVIAELWGIADPAFGLLGFNISSYGRLLEHLHFLRRLLSFFFSSLFWIIIF